MSVMATENQRAALAARTSTLESKVATLEAGVTALGSSVAAKQDALTSTQLAKVNNALTDASAFDAKGDAVSAVNNHDTDARHLKSGERQKWDAKQDALTTEQVAAVNSGITPDLVAKIGTGSGKPADYETVKINAETGASHAGTTNANPHGVSWSNLRGSKPDILTERDIAQGITQDTSVTTLAGVKAALLEGTGTYTKPTTGIPKTDLSQAVKASLEKADAALPNTTAYVASASVSTDKKTLTLTPNTGSEVTFSQVEVVSPDSSDGISDDGRAASAWGTKQALGSKVSASKNFATKWMKRDESIGLLRVNGDKFSLSDVIITPLEDWSRMAIPEYLNKFTKVNVDYKAKIVFDGTSFNLYIADIDENIIRTYTVSEADCEKSVVEYESYATDTAPKASYLTESGITSLFSSDGFKSGIKSTLTSSDNSVTITQDETTKAVDLKVAGGCGSGDVTETTKRYELNTVTKDGTETIDTVVYDKYTVKDFAINTISLTTDNPVRIYLPEYTTTSARDFVVKINVTASEAPEVNFIKSAKDTSVGFESGDDKWQTLELGINYFSFTESER